MGYNTELAKRAISPARFNRQCWTTVSQSILKGAVPVDYADRRRHTELEKLRMEIRKMQRDKTMDAWKLAIATASVIAGLGTAAKALGWL